MQILLIISVLLGIISFLTLLGFGITLIVGLSTKKRTVKKVGKIGMIIAGSILLISIFQTTVTSSSINKQETQEAKKEASSKEDDSDDDDENDDLDYDDDSSEDESSSDDDLTVGDTQDFESGASITVNSIEDSSAALQDTDGHAVAVNVTVENTESSALDFNAQEFDLYDGDDELAEFDASTYDSNIPSTIAPGKKATMTLTFGAKGHAPYSVSFGDAIWNSDN